MANPTLVVPAKAEHSATVIAIHGLGGDGKDWESVIDTAFRHEFRHVKWVLPNAPVRGVTALGGTAIPAWCDLFSFELEKDLGEDEVGMLESVHALDELIQGEINSGIPASRVVMMGFSQGAGMTLLTALTGGEMRGRPEFDGWRLAGIAVLSGRLLLRSKFQPVSREFAPRGYLSV
ncbi:hypothetical protein HYDPIDRAFT_104598 [Hydnomerulius pinastri MD-312]|nr:hypothetical protein HYDPIDRAFT_104598 [Hydnomerulius pinastri MD-312]